MENETKMENETNPKEISGIREKTHKSIDKIMDKVESINESGKEKIDYLKEKAKEKAAIMKENVDGYIEKNPEKSVLIAAGIGAVAGATIAAVMLKKKTTESADLATAQE